MAGGGADFYLLHIWHFWSAHNEQRGPACLWKLGGAREKNFDNLIVCRYLLSCCSFFNHHLHKTLRHFHISNLSNVGTMHIILTDWRTGPIIHFAQVGTLLHFQLICIFKFFHPYLIIGWSRGIWPCGPSRPGPMCGTTRGGQYKKCGMVEVIRAQRGRARSALFRRVWIIND